MSGNGIDRRAALALGGVAMLAPAMATAGSTERAAGILLFAADSPEAHRLAAQARGQRLIALQGDPVRVWRDTLAGFEGPIGGITQWSDYVILRGLAAERGLRIRREESIPVQGSPLLIRWEAA